MPKVTRNVVLKRIKFWEGRKGQFSRKQERLWRKELRGRFS